VLTRQVDRVRVRVDSVSSRFGIRSGTRIPVYITVLLVIHYHQTFDTRHSTFDINLSILALAWQFKLLNYQCEVITLRVITLKVIALNFRINFEKKKFKVSKLRKAGNLSL
jgi:hypothetical protein